MPAKKATKKNASSKRFAMSDEHKKALADGRAQGRAVRAYLDALNQAATKPRGRKPSQTPDEIQAAIDAEADPTKRLDLIQKRLDVEERLAAEAETVDLDALQAEFIEAAKPYGERKGISYPAWREAGVPAAVLKDAGIPRTRRS